MTKSPRADLALYDREGRLTALAEIKNKRGTSPDWAAKLRGNLFAHGGFHLARFFLIVTPDRIYLWTDSDDSPGPFDPTLVVDARALLEPYFDRAEVSPETVSGPAFELIVGSWLADLVLGDRGQAEPGAGLQGLIDTGFVSAVREGRVEYELAA